MTFLDAKGLLTQPRVGMLAVLALAACTSHPPGQRDLLSFLQDGVTTRKEAETRIQQFPGEWEGGRLLTFRIGEDSDGYYPAPARHDWTGVRYSLVLEFDAAGVLRRHALVDVKKGT